MYGSVNNIKHGKMENTFMNFASVTASWDAAFTKLTTTNGNLSTYLRQQKDHIRSLQEEFYNLKVEAETRPAKVKRSNKKLQIYERDKKQIPKGPTYLTEKKNNNRNYCWSHGYDTRNPQKSYTRTRANNGLNKKAVQRDPISRHSARGHSD